MANTLMIAGRSELPRPLPITTVGQLEFSIAGGDLRGVQVAGLEVVRRIHVAIRDPTWGEVPGQLVTLDEARSRDRLAVRFRSHHVRSPLSFVWEGMIEVSAPGTITYRMDGQALADFPYSRMGLVALHPLNSCGRCVLVSSRDGERRRRLPLSVGPQRYARGSPQPLVGPYSYLTVEHPHGVRSRFAFDGGLFEMEDQRNWSDASFKTYSSPIAPAWPQVAKAGQRFSQRIEVRIEGRPTVKPARPSDVPRIRIGSCLGPRLPPIGHAMPSEGERPSHADITALRGTRPAHVRVDLHLGDPAMTGRLRDALETASALNAPLEVAVTMGPDHVRGLSVLAAALSGTDRLSRILVFDGREVTGNDAVSVVRSALRTAVPAGVGIIGGSTGPLADINRVRPSFEMCDGVAFSLNPQVHALDDLTLIENIEAQGATVATARAIAKGRGVTVSPITLRPQSSPWTLHDTIPDGVDRRQVSLLAAAWTIGSLQELITARAASLTYFELIGWRGLLERDRKPPDQADFPSVSSMVFPVFHVFAALSDHRHVETRRLVGAVRGRFAGFALVGMGRTRVVLANLRPTSQSVRVELPDSSRFAILDERTVGEASHHPRWLWETRWTRLRRIDLGAYGIAIIDAGENAIGGRSPAAQLAGER